MNITPHLSIYSKPGSPFNKQDNHCIDNKINCSPENIDQVADLALFIPRKCI